MDAPETYCNTNITRTSKIILTKCPTFWKIKSTNDPLLPTKIMPKSAKPGWVDWLKCPAREVILHDLGPGEPLYNRNHLIAEEIFVFYKETPAFKDVVFLNLKTV